jgi:hypothetical protein
MDYWVEIIEQQVEWTSDAASSEDAEEAGMADFEKRHGERRQYYYYSGVHTDDPNRPGPHIRARPGTR